MAKTAAKKAPTKTEVYNSIAETTGLTKKEVASVLDALNAEIGKALSSRGAGMFTIPGLVKVTKKKVPAKPADPTYVNPFNGKVGRDAQPAKVKVVVRALKALKDMV